MPLVLTREGVKRVELPGPPPASETVIRPQMGPQEMFLSTSADIAGYGGAAGGGKSYGLLMEPVRHIHVPGFSAVFFRRTYPDIKNPGGLRDTAVDLYLKALGKPRNDALEWYWPSTATVTLSHLQHDSDVYNWMGSQVALIGFDELTHFTERMFFYLLSRNRSSCGVKPYVRCTFNPDPDSWVKAFFQWWIDERTGFPIQERAGVLRYFVRKQGKIIWSDSPDDLPLEKTPTGETIAAKSVTFIPSNIYDNKILLKINPEYLGNLTSLPAVERQQLLDGNWNIRRVQGSYFKREHVKVIDAIPEGWVSSVRYWDRAATEASEENPDPDWTAGVRILRYASGRILVADVRHFRGRPAAVERAILNTAMQDGTGTLVGLEQDPGSAGCAEIDNLIRLLQGYNVRPWKVIDTKHVRWLPFSAQWEHGNVDVLRGNWNEDYFSELESLGPDEDLYAHDDQGDASAGAFHFTVTSGRPRAMVA